MFFHLLSVLWDKVGFSGGLMTFIVTRWENRKEMPQGSGLRSRNATGCGRISNASISIVFRKLMKSLHCYLIFRLPIKKKKIILVGRAFYLKRTKKTNFVKDFSRTGKLVGGSPARGVSLEGTRPGNRQSGI